MTAALATMAPTKKAACTPSAVAATGFAPSEVAAAAVTDIRVTIDNADELIDAAVEAAGADVDVLTIRATVAAMDAIIRVVFGEWVRRSELGDAASAGEIYREVIAGLAPLGAHLARDAGN